MDNEPDLTIAEFCLRRKFSKWKYFALKAKGRGPAEVADGRCVRITREAERDWLKAHTEPTTTEARLLAREAAARIRSARKAGLAAGKSKRHVSKRQSSRVEA